MSDFRLCTLNLWGPREPFELRMTLAIRQLRELALDAVALQEVTEDMARRVAQGLAMEVKTAPAGARGLAVLAPALTGAEITELPHEGLLLSATTDNVRVHCTHLAHPVDASAERLEQVRAIAPRLTGHWLLCGDMNAEPASEEMEFLGSLGRDAMAGSQEVTWSTERGEARLKRTVKHDRRIDYVFAAKSATVAAARVVVDARVDGGCASDHYGVMAQVRFPRDKSSE